jgi:protein-S-isoprenylcysteine O-methyltransferase Ste14
MIPAAMIIPILAARIIDEERVLERDLPGYRDYQARTRHRLLPGIW